ncbi:hypothetical protein [Actinomadura nitritigenes]|uniref:hypothetical protein n=1 Tax=Actinomadura nitritigenes TaxID=134602 RepID=UPI003D8D9684
MTERWRDPERTGSPAGRPGRAPMRGRARAAGGPAPTPHAPAASAAGRANGASAAAP